ncbi:MAG: hypothetical protein LAO23_05275 [Acidobacteriia bacterium]|nr:hypothetical protein [Terriglobia bacterium]
MSEIHDLNFKLDSIVSAHKKESDAEAEIVYERPHRFPIFDANRNKLYEAAKIIGEMWCNLDANDPDPDLEDDEFVYRGGVIMLTFRYYSPYADGWVDLTYNQVITDIFYGQRWYHQHKTWNDVMAELDKDAKAKEAARSTQLSVNSKGKRYCDCEVCDSMTEAGCPNAPTLDTGGKYYCHWCAPYPNGPEGPTNRHETR